MSNFRNAWFDGENVDDTNLSTEQAAWFSGISNAVNISDGGGVEKEFATQPIIFDSYNVPPSISRLMASTNFDGTPIYSTDAYGITIFSQPSDSSEGDQLQVILSGANLIGSFVVRVYIFGTVFGGTFSYEVLTFTQNESQTTEQYFTSLVSIMTQDWLGNNNSVVTGVPCRNAGGRIQILEALPMTVVRDDIMISQAVEPNMDFVGFRPSNISLNLNQVLEQIAVHGNLNVNDLQINVTATGTRTLPPNSGGTIIGEKFKAFTNNIQKVSTLLSVENDIVNVFNWSGSIILGIRKLQSSVTCPTDIVPSKAIEFDPYPVSIAEISFTQQDLKALGIILTDKPQVIDFVFANSILGKTTSAIEIGQYYAITITRSGDTSYGTLVLQEASNITTDITIMRESIFSQNIWTDIVGANIWFKVSTSAVRITNGTAYDNGIQIVSPKIAIDASTGNEAPYNEDNHSLLNTSYTTDNFVIVQAANLFEDPIPHPATGNPVFTHVEDVPDVSVVSKTNLETLIDSGNKTIVLADVKNENNTAVNNSTISGQTIYPGMLTANQFTIFAPSQDLLANNLVGSFLTPDLNMSTLVYRITKVDIYDDAYGDVNNDGVIDTNDVGLIITLDGYSKTSFTTAQLNAITTGVYPMADIIRADVNDNGVIEGNIYGNRADAIAVQLYIQRLPGSLLTGNIFKRMVLTTENVFDPGTTTVDMIGDNPAFNQTSGGAFTPIPFVVTIFSLWKPENLIITDMRRYISKTFTSLTDNDIAGNPKNGGQNIKLVSGDILLGGQIKNPDGTPYSLDLEVGTIILELPDGYVQGEIDVFNNFINGKMMFFDGTLVGTYALANNQVRVSAGIQSIAKEYGNFIDVPAGDSYGEVGNAIGVYYIQTSGILRINTGNIDNTATRPELRTKVVLTVYLKKAGFRNAEQVVFAAVLAPLIT